MPKNPMRKVTIADIQQYIVNGGLKLEDTAFDFARENDAFGYVGYSRPNHKFLLGFEDEENEGNFYASTVYVELGRNGLLCADFGGCPDFEGTEEEVIKYIKDRVNQTVD